MESSEKVIGFIKSGKLQEGIEILCNSKDSLIKNEAIHLSGRLIDLESRKRKGTISNDDFFLERNNIQVALLELSELAKTIELPIKQQLTKLLNIINPEILKTIARKLSLREVGALSVFITEENINKILKIQEKEKIKTFAILISKEKVFISSDKLRSTTSLYDLSYGSALRCTLELSTIE